MSPKLLDEWQAFSQLEPFGDEWRQVAQTCATILNSQGGKKGGGAFTADDFMPKTPSARAGAQVESTVTKAHRQKWIAFTQHRNKEGHGLVRAPVVEPIG